MASSSCTPLLVLTLALTFLLTGPSHAARSEPSLVDKICKATPFPDLCISAFAALPGTGVKGIARAVVYAAADKTMETLKYLLNQPPDQDPSFDLVVSECTDTYTRTGAALLRAKVEISPSVISDLKNNVTADLAFCRKTFEREFGPFGLPKRHELVEHLLSVLTKILTFL